MKEELLKGLTVEQKNKILACRNAEGILALAKEEGITLNDEQLEAVSGGDCNNKGFMQCPNCKKRDLTCLDDKYHQGGVSRYRCNSCGLEFTANW